MSAYTLYLVLSAAANFNFSVIVTVDQVYLVQQAHLNPLQLVLLGTVLELSVLIFEIPTGILADVYSRKWSVIVGLFLIGAGFFLEGWVPRFEVILLAQVIWGVGYTFTSGAQQAWIADEIGIEKAGTVFLRGAQFAQIGGLIGIGASVALGYFDVRTPILVGGILYMALGVFLILFMPERGFTRSTTGERPSWGAMVRTVREAFSLVRVRPALVTIFTVSLCFGMFSESFDRLWTPYLLTSFTFPDLFGLRPVVWFGVIQAVGALLTIFALAGVQRWLDTDHHKRLMACLIVLNAILIGAIVLFVTASLFGVALLMLWLIIVAREVNDPLVTTWLNKHVPSQVRATVFSMRSQSDAIGQVAGGPALGAIATAYTIPFAFLIGVVFLIPGFWLYARNDRTE